MDDRGGSPFWRFSLRHYGRPGIADICLRLQDELGFDVNLLLFAAWLGLERGRRLTPVELDEIVALTRDWRLQVVEPLRAIRRRLKVGPPPAPSDATEPLRQRIKGAELEAERLQQELLHAWAGADPGDASPGPKTAQANLEAYARHLGAGPSEVLDADLMRLAATV